jgi:SAM-dependent methyltransferase
MDLLSRLFRSRHIHGDVGSRFKKYMDEGLLLDLPAGDGVNSRGLVSSGFEVVAGDLFPESVHCDGIAIEKVDLEKPLPFTDEYFDGILFSEGIEHLDAQILCLKEMARILKPGGLLIVTTPNVLHIGGRLSFLLTGHAHRNRSPVVATSQYWGGTAEEVYFGHVFLINAFQLRFYLEHAGFEVVGVDTTRYSINSVLLAPLLYPFVWLATRRLLGNKRKAKLSKEMKRSYIGQILSTQVMFGKKLIMVAKKQERATV